MADTFERIKKLIVEHTEIDESKITLQSSFSDDLGADSLDIVEIIMALEEQFEIEITDEEANNLITIKDAVDFVNNKLSKKENI
ncbi:acyl carrier protein [Candidatus Azoamicus ciliaticola]|uniref:Acyl carrier protein n=1 Tax=Candidatus Azoamicus ciliaticola TaxID=2652803 RepID=A0A6J5JYS5_9GAMM|nr:acyl carrier protein [Candidatus Azoamicus ciliaticola]CAB3976493.1 Acyl carrier protein [Candidatus Azoamicus ciliaticola]